MLQAIHWWKPEKPAFGGRALFPWMALASILLLAGTPQSRMTPGEVKTYMYQFQKMEDEASVDLLAKSTYDLLIVEPVGTYRSGSLPEMKTMVTRLRGKRPGRLVVAYLDIAEADSHRAYWERGWKAPAKDRKGNPDFLLGPDPDGWEDTYLVRYWDPRWQALLISDAEKILSAGFDGLCLDWAGAYLDPTIIPLAKAAQIDPARSVVDLIVKIREAALKLNPKASLLLQNALGLLVADPRIADLVDALVQEGIWYGGKAEVAWSDPDGGDRVNRATGPGRSTDDLLAQVVKWRAIGKPVFTLDYCLKTDHAGQVYERAKSLGAVPLVSRSALDRMTETPPPWLP
jgi:cysteinyl-tRNA synthetase